MKKELTQREWERKLEAKIFVTCKAPVRSSELVRGEATGTPGKRSQKRLSTDRHASLCVNDAEISGLENDQVAARLTSNAEVSDRRDKQP